MNDTVREWIEKAEGDHVTARRELAASERPNYDAVCFHAHQCVEKLMKGVLIHLGVMPPRTHNLLGLDQLLRPTCSQWNPVEDDLGFLTRVGGAFRYPGATAERQDALESMVVCERLRDNLLKIVNTP